MNLFVLSISLNKVIHCASYLPNKNRFIQETFINVKKGFILTIFKSTYP